MKKILLLASTIICFSNIINAQAGQLDSTFATNGIVTTDLGESYKSGSRPAVQILSLPDRGFYVLQDVLSKRRANGSLDSSFGINGSAAFVGYSVQKMAIEPDGKIIVATSYNGLARFNTDGSVDSSFSKNGKLINYSIRDLAIQKDGKIILVDGSGVFRYNTDASLDTTFSGDGHVTTNSININSIAIQSDGKIVGAGVAYKSSDFKNTYFGVVRYNINGTLDKSFSVDGIQTTDFGSHDIGQTVAIQSDGKIVVAGESTGSFALARYNTDGSLDKSFSGDGKQTANLSTSSFVYSIAFQTNGKIVVSSGGTLIRFNTDGSLDSAIFKNTGFSTNSIAIQSDGKILAGGAANYNNLALARYNTDGSLDNTFNGNGKLTDIARAGNTGYKKTIVQKDGKIVAAGSKWNGKNYDFAVARYNTDGSPDNTFSGDGIQTTDFAAENDYAKSVAIQEDGKIIVAGVHALARYNTDGSLDKTFSGDGKKTTADSIYITSVAIQSDGKIVVAGEKNSTENSNNEYGEDIGYAAVARYNTDGSADKTFGVDGRQTDILYQYGVVSSLLIQNDGKIVIAGVFATDDSPYSKGFIILARLNTNGSLDTTFDNNNGYTYFSGRFDYGTSCAIIKQNDDKIVIAVTGYYRSLNFNTTSLGRFNIDGSIDSSFKKYAGYASDNRDQNTSIALQNDGKIVVAGLYLSRFNTDGSNDSTFNIDAAKKVNFAIQDITIANNKLYAAGGGQYGTIARYLLDGTNTSPTVTLTTPADSTVRLAPAAHIKLSAAAADIDGTITKVEFYNGNKLLHTETVIPYGYVWRNVGLGNYTITAKAYDNSGNVATSAPIHISVVPNKAPIVSIISPASNQVFADTATIRLIAAASDTDGRITNVKFYNGTTLLRTEFKLPYTYNWQNAAAGTYTITAVATDNWGTHTTSAPVTITVTSSKAMILSNKPVTYKTGIKEEISVKLYPNPATNIVNLYTSGLQQNKPADISVMSISGIVLKKVQISSAAQMQLDVSSLAKGVYTIKIVSGDKVIFKQFVKL